jgi:hypothetical protein
MAKEREETRVYVRGQRDYLGIRSLPSGADLMVPVMNSQTKECWFRNTTCRGRLFKLDGAVEQVALRPVRAKAAVAVIFSEITIVPEVFQQQYLEHLLVDSFPRNILDVGSWYEWAEIIDGLDYDNDMTYQEKVLGEDIVEVYRVRNFVFRDVNAAGNRLTNEKWLKGHWITIAANDFKVMLEKGFNWDSGDDLDEWLARQGP